MGSQQRAACRLCFCPEGSPPTSAVGWRLRAQVVPGADCLVAMAAVSPTREIPPLLLAFGFSRHPLSQSKGQKGSPVRSGLRPPLQVPSFRENGWPPEHQGREPSLQPLPRTGVVLPMPSPVPSWSTATHKGWVPTSARAQLRQRAAERPPMLLHCQASPGARPLISGQLDVSQLGKAPSTLLKLGHPFNPLHPVMAATP